MKNEKLGDDWVRYNQQNINQTCSSEHCAQTRQLFSDSQFQLSTANRQCNTNGGDSLGQMSQTINAHGDIWWPAFDSNALKMDFERTACTSTNARKHIQRAYYQQQLWVQAPFTDATSILNADAYGFVRKGSLLVPEIVISKPEGLPDPCSCGKCAHKNGCPCRVAGIRCCNANAGEAIVVKILSLNELSSSSPYLDSVVKVLPCNTGNKPVVCIFHFKLMWKW